MVHIFGNMAPWTNRTSRRRVTYCLTINQACIQLLVVVLWHALLIFAHLEVIIAVKSRDAAWFLPRSATGLAYMHSVQLYIELIVRE